MGPLTVTRLASASDAEALATLAEEVVSWRRPPSGWSGGRSGWLEVPEVLAAPDRRGLKLKGLGRAPWDGVPARPPGVDLYDRWDGQGEDPHFGIDDDLEFCLRNGDPAPVGGLLEVSVLREQRCSAALVAAGVPAVWPVAAFRYEDRVLTHRGVRQHLGVSVTASPNRSDARCSVVLAKGDKTEVGGLDRLATTLGVDPDSRGAPRRLQILGAVYESFGAALRGFADAGWFRYSGHPGNLIVDDAGRAVLVDLDSCREMSTVSAERGGAEMLRDGMSALYNLSCSFYSAAAMELVDDASLRSHEPFSAFLRGWDPGSSPEAAERDGRAIAEYVISSRARLRHFGHFLASPRPEASHLYRYVRHDRDVTFTWFFRLLARRRLARPTGPAVPWTAEELDKRLHRFSGLERFTTVLDLDGRR